MSHGPVDGGHDKYEILYQPYINSLQIGVLCDLIFNALNDLTDDIMKRCFFFPVSPGQKQKQNG